MSWIYGVVLNLIGSITINGGTNLMKLGLTHSNTATTAIFTSTNKSHNCENHNDSSSTLCKKSNSADDIEKSMEQNGSLKTRGAIWYVGSLLFVFGNIVNFVSFSFAAQSLLAAIGSAQFVSNVFFSKIVLGETITRRTIYATCAILFGNILVVYSFSSGSTSENDSVSVALTANEVIGNFDRDYMWFLVGLIALFCSCRLVFVRIKTRVDNGHDVPYANRILPTAYAAYSAILGSQSVLLAKCLSILLRTAIDGNKNDTANDADAVESVTELFIDEVYITQFILLGWLVTISFWLRQMNRALAQFDGVFIIPVLQVFWTFFSIISGGVFFKEFLSFSTSQSTGFIIGIIIVFYGVALLSAANANNMPPSKSKVIPISKVDVSTEKSPVTMKYSNNV